MFRFIALFLSFIILAGCGGGDNNTSAPSPQPTATTTPTPTPTPDPLVWEINDSRFGSPESVFTLPEPSASGGLYLPDVQASFPEVDWQTLDRLYIPAGHYSFIRLGNLPQRTEASPLIISNRGGQVRVGGLGHYYLLVLGGGSHWVLTGRFDPISETGNENYPGHRGGAFANSQDSYGIMVDDDFIADSISGLAVGGATAFEIEFVEIKEVGFAGMLLKTDNDGDAHMENVHLHDNYVHDTGSEGLYIGSTQSQPQHQIRDWQINNNRILRTGTEAIQLGQLAGNTRVHNNVFGPAAVDWRAAFQAYQDNNFQIGLREGHLEVDNNIFIGSAGSMISFFAAAIEGDSSADNVGATFHDNYFTGMRNLGMYINNVTLENMRYRFEDNVFTNYRFDRDQVYDVDPYDHLLRIANTTTPILLLNNSWQGPEKFSNLIDNNGTNGNMEASNNVKQSAEALNFVNSGLPAEFNYLDLEMWAATATRGDDQPVDYPQDTIVTHLGLVYRCDQSICTGGNEPPDHPDMWTALPSFADDVRIQPGTTWEALGLQAP